MSALDTLFQQRTLQNFSTELAGPSNSGFTDPAQYSVLTLVEVTNALLSAIEGLEWRLISLSLMSMAHEVIAAFVLV